MNETKEEEDILALTDWLQQQWVSKKMFGLSLSYLIAAGGKHQIEWDLGASLVKNNSINNVIHRRRGKMAIKISASVSSNEIKVLLLKIRGFPIRSVLSTLVTRGVHTPE